MNEKRAVVKVRSKLYVVFWLLLHGFIPEKAFWYKRFRTPFKTSHKVFSYGKFKTCGNTCIAVKRKRETWDLGSWDFPEGLLKIKAIED